MHPDNGHYIYVHVPFCEQKCTYCDFFTITDPSRSHPLAPAWLEICAREAELWQQTGDMDSSQPIRTVFFGGGTPSLLPPDALAAFLATLSSRFNFAPDAEVTLETQPNTVDSKNLEAFAQAGINRFSIGVQTFNPQILLTTGRRHTVDESRAALTAAAATARIVSLDLICAWPGQSIAEWQSDLREAISSAPAHISTYELTFHEGTALTRDRKAGRTAEAEEEIRIAMYECTRSTLLAAGYEHYEISNYAKPAARSVHNQNYWQLGNYIGLGAGAHSLVWPNRYANPNSATDYARAIQSGQLFRRLSNTSDSDVFLAENLQMALRYLDGVDLELLSRRMGRNVLAGRATRIKQLHDEGLVRLDDGHLSLTPVGELRSDTIVEYLL